MSTELERYFAPFRANIIGIDQEYDFPTGRHRIVYADWAASGRLYRPIEDFISKELGPFVANTHTETNLTGTLMTDAYHQAHAIIKKHVNAGPEDVLLFVGFGMTAAINKFQRLLGLRIPDHLKPQVKIPPEERPLVILTHMEHHSNQTTWEECCCDVILLCKKADGLPNLEQLQEILEMNRHRQTIIGSFTACSNVTGIITPYHKMAEIMHRYGGLCFVDFSASAPYVPIDMHPANPAQKLDAVFFSPHKFLGGPGSSGVLIFNKHLYKNITPDQPGGGTVIWTNPWGQHRYYPDIELREDGGTPGFLQAIRGALAICLKERMGTDKILEQEHVLLEVLWRHLSGIPEINILEPQNKERLAFVSFYCPTVHHNLIVRLLNDRFGIQVRGGCLCAGTYGHVLLHIDPQKSQTITSRLDEGDFSLKPGWVRISLHPTMTREEVEYIGSAVETVVKHASQWAEDYHFDIHSGEFVPLNPPQVGIDLRRDFRPI